MSALKSQTLSPTPAPHPSLRRRILRMSTVWAALGAVMGAGVGLEGGGFIGAVGGMIAGVVELATLGAIFALVGGRPGETVLGAVGGLLVGLAVGMAGGRAPIVFVASFGLACGAIAGATLRAYFRLLSLPVVLLGRMRRRHQRPAAIALRRDGLVEPQPFVPAPPRHATINHPVRVRGPLDREPVGFPRAEAIPSND